MSFLNEKTARLCTVLVVLMVVSGLLFFVYRYFYNRSALTKPVKLIPAVSYLALSASSLINLAINYDTGDSIDPEGLLTLLLAPYYLLVAPIIIIVSIGLLVIALPEPMPGNRSIAVGIVVALMVLGALPLLGIAFTEPLIVVIVMAAKLVSGGTAIYYITHGEQNDDRGSVFYDPFDNID